MWEPTEEQEIEMEAYEDPKRLAKRLSEIRMMYADQQATIAALEAEVKRLRAALDTETDAALETWGVLTGIRAWLRGDLPEADATQFLALIDGLDADARRALESDTP